MRSATVGEYHEDKAFEERFIPHVQEIIPAAIFAVNVSPPEDDFKHNSDYGLTVNVPLTSGSVLAIASRIRRAGYKKRRSQTGHPFTREVTVRYTRPSGVETEFSKMSAGWGEVMIYGFESSPGSTRLDPWIVLNIRALVEAGTQWRERKPNRDGSSDFVTYWLEDLPRDVVLRSAGIPTPVIGSIWRAQSDPRYAPYTRMDGWAEAANIHPNPRERSGWICPSCGRTDTVFIGGGPTYDYQKRLYVGPDDRCCRPCAAHRKGE